MAYKNKEKRSACQKRWNSKNRVKVNEMVKKWRKKNPEKFKQYILKYLSKKENREKAKIATKNWFMKNPGYANKYHKQRIKKDVLFKLKILLRSRFISAFKNRCKTGSAIKLLGCSVDELKKYLELKFLEGMNWKNHEKNGWHIDHIKPFASFNLTNPEQQAKVCHYTNLQPLWAIDNYKKNSKILK